MNRKKMTGANNIDNVAGATQSDKPALWGGIECSITRVRGKYQDQLHLSGHYDRETDLDAIARIGFSALRFPILIEKHQPRKGKPIDWSWAEERLNKLREKNIIPIAGLVHHGSGPAYTNLLSRNFATSLAAYAGEVARKFPWIEYYTPVNEPLTTARFSGLYGLWYPHHTRDRSFCKMLVNELTAVVLSMQEIRKVNPQAKLVQTEDLGKVYSTDNLQYQADFENERRWLTFDLLCGRVDQDHHLWAFLLEHGVSRKALEFFLNNPCPPSILGLNYYVTSERFLDDNIEAYPESLHGGNHIEKYVDTEAVRVDHQQPSGLRSLLQEVHERYGLPMAMTEIHLHCSREEQLRWFNDAWNVCCDLKKEGLDIRAVTAWSLIGAFGWNKLLTSPECDYEPGVFDLRSPIPRPTAVAKLISAVARGEQFKHAVLEQPGWWKRKDRFHKHYAVTNGTNMQEKDINGSPILLYGNGIIANALARICHLRAIPFLRRNTDRGNMSPEEDIMAAIAFYNPWAIISADIYDDTKLKNRHQIFEVNKVFATHCKNHNLPFLYFSDASVFAASSHEDCYEHDITQPDTDLGRMHQIIEEEVLNEYPESLIVRSGTLFCPFDEQNFANKIIRSLQARKIFKADESTIQSFSYVPDLVNNAMDLLIDGESGICHLVSPQKMSEFDFAIEICRQANISPNLVMPLELNNERNSVTLSATRFTIMPSLQCSVENFIRDFSSPPVIFNHVQL